MGQHHSSSYSSDDDEDDERRWSHRGRARHGSTGDASPTGPASAAAATFVPIADSADAAARLSGVVWTVLQHCSSDPAPARRALRLACKGTRDSVDDCSLRVKIQGARQLRLLVSGACVRHRFRSVAELHLVAVGPACLRALADSAASLGGALPLRALKVSAHPRACFSADGENGGGSGGGSSFSGSGRSSPASRRACDAAALAFASKLIALPRLARLEVLIADLPPGAVDAIITAAACVPELTKFVLSSPASLGGDALAAALARPATWPALEELSLCGVDAAALEALAAASLPALRALDLADNPGIGPRGAAALARASWLPRLHALRLPESLESDAVAALMHSAEFRALRDAGRAMFGDSADLPPVPRPRGRGGGGGWGHDDDGDGDEGHAVWDGAGLVEEALGAAAVAAAATVAVAMALATAGGRR